MGLDRAPCSRPRVGPTYIPTLPTPLTQPRPWAQLSRKGRLRGVCVWSLDSRGFAERPSSRSLWGNLADKSPGAVSVAWDPPCSFISSGGLGPWGSVLRRVFLGTTWCPLTMAEAAPPFLLGCTRR